MKHILTALAALALLASGCGASALSTHAQAATVTASITAQAGIAVDQARDAALDEVQRQHAASTAEEHDAAVLREAARWEPAGAALDVVRSALLVWLEAIQVAHASGDGDGLLALLLPLAARAALAYGEVARLLASLGVEGVPELPADVRALAQGIGGGQ